jgi:predicted N-acetyltransferase YhbS
MATTYRKAGAGDREALLDLIARGFAVDSQGTLDLREGEEHRILFSYLYSLPGWDPGRVFVAEEAGQLLAAVGFFPQVLSLDRADIPVWAISPVVTAPEARGRGLAGHCLNLGMEEVRQQGIPAAFLWGIPDFYPRFGFVPVLPRYRTRLALAAARVGDKDGRERNGRGRLREYKVSDLLRIGELYSGTNRSFWLQPLRTAEWWRDRLAELDIEAGVLREVPFPERRNFLVWEKNDGSVAGYLYYKEEIRRERIIITEAVASSPGDASLMLQQLVTKIVAKTKDASQPNQVVIQGTPLHLLNSAAYRMGGTHLDPAPRFGMLKILDWDAFLAMLGPVLRERLDPWPLSRASEGARIGFEPDGALLQMERSPERLTFHFTKPPQSAATLQLLTRLFLGFYDLEDLSLIQCDPALRQRLFPAKYPFIWDANYLY